ncbi:hypothetical protein [Burkholderia cepacia]|uniref:hypothetical protein n=1 Tax=Burkholderia cepacia TaxID=292 RepID=UPI00076D519C|nr:hypothetical protein [Burkholderia cepacia]KVW81382.1 hypothetical protein WL00_29305 [Burkholderia cepacia]
MQPRRWRAPRPSISLLAAITCVAGLTIVLSHLLGLSDVAIFMALVALFTSIGLFGGTLRVDLTVTVWWLAGLTALVALPLSVGLWWKPGGAILFVVGIGCCGLAPALGKRYRSVRLGLGLVAVYAYGYHSTHSVSAGAIVVGAFVAFAVPFCLRMAVGARDPDAPLRAALARSLTDERGQALEAASASWLEGPSREWLGRVLAGTARYRAAVSRLRESAGDTAPPDLSAMVLVELARSSTALGEIVRARRIAPESHQLIAADLDRMSRLADVHTDSRPEFRTGLKDAVKGLEEVLHAAEARSGRMVSVAGPVRRRLALIALQAALSWRSDHLRGAMRAMVTVATSLCAVALTDRREVALPFLMASYGILQATPRASVIEAARRVAGVTAGGGIGILVALTTPAPAADWAAAAALIVAFAYLASSISVFMAGLVIALTLEIAPSLGISPTHYAVSYLVAVLGGALVAVAIGFGTIRNQSVAEVEHAARRAMQSCAAALDAAAAGTPVPHPALIQAFRDQQNIGTGPDDANAGSSEVGSALMGINLISLASALGPSDLAGSTAATMTGIATALRRGAAQPLPPALDERHPTMTTQLLYLEYERLRIALAALAVTAPDERGRGPQLGQSRHKT